MLTKVPTLADLRTAADQAERDFLDTVAREFPGADEWTWYRAVDAAEGGFCRRNDDTSRDAALAASVTIKTAHDRYIAALHTFYRARDGEGGVLGGRGL